MGVVVVKWVRERGPDGRNGGVLTTAGQIRGWDCAFCKEQGPADKGRRYFFLLVLIHQRPENLQPRPMGSEKIKNAPPADKRQKVEQGSEQFIERMNERLNLELPF